MQTIEYEGVKMNAWKAMRFGCAVERSARMHLAILGGQVSVLPDGGNEDKCQSSSLVFVPESPDPGGRSRVFRTVNELERRRRFAIWFDESEP